MKLIKLFPFTLVLVMFAACEEKGNGSPLCNSFTLNNTFTAKIDESWCLKNTDFKITFGPLIEDSRCNVPGIDCIWAGRYVMAATFENGETVQDTFFAEYNWTDTLYQSGYKVILEKVYPVTRQTMESLPPSSYSFDIRVQQ